jgi:hypothetical protein
VALVRGFRRVRRGVGISAQNHIKITFLPLKNISVVVKTVFFGTNRTFVGTGKNRPDSAQIVIL